MDVASFHAPHRWHPKSVRGSFWKYFGDEVRHVSVEGAPLIMAGDANTEVGSIVSEAIGAHAAEEE